MAIEIDRKWAERRQTDRQRKEGGIGEDGWIDTRQIGKAEILLALFPLPFPANF